MNVVHAFYSCSDIMLLWFYSHVASGTWPCCSGTSVPLGVTRHGRVSTDLPRFKSALNPKVVFVTYDRFLKPSRSRHQAKRIKVKINDTQATWVMVNVTGFAVHQESVYFIPYVQLFYILCWRYVVNFVQKSLLPWYIMWKQPFFM